MIFLLLRLIVTLLHAALIFAGAPLLLGIVTKCRACLQRRRGAPVLQPYRDLRKLLGKATLTPDTATEFYPVWPYASFAAIGAAALLVPGFCTGMVGAGQSDFITVIFLLGLARAATVLAGLETGFGFGGAGAARAVLSNIFAEAAMLTAALTFVLIGGDPTIDGAAQHVRAGGIGVSLPLGFALVTVSAVALAQTGRLTCGLPELAAVDEAMLLEYSGRYLALFEYTRMLLLMVWMCLIGTMFVPFGMADAGAILSWPGGLLLWGVKLGVMAAALAVFETVTIKMRVFQVPATLGVATLLGIVAVILLLVAGRTGA